MNKIVLSLIISVVILPLFNSCSLIEDLMTGDTIVSIELQPSLNPVPVGGEIYFEVNGIRKDGKIETGFSDGITFVSSNPTVLALKGDGSQFFLAQSIGFSSVTGTYDGMTDVVEVEVSGNPATGYDLLSPYDAETGVSVDLTALTITYNGDIDPESIISGNLIDYDTNTTINFTSEDITVSNNQVTISLVSQLSPDTTYNVTISGVYAINGTDLMTLYWYFTTEAGENNNVSTVISAPSVISGFNITDTFTMPEYSIGGYIDFPTTAGNGYGIYITDADGIISLDGGYSNGSWVSYGVGTVNPVGTNDNYLGFDDPAGLADIMVKVGNSTDSAITFSITVVETPMAGYEGTASAIEIGAPTNIAAKWLKSDYLFTAYGTTANFSFTNLTAGIDIEIFSEDGSTSIFGPTTDGVEEQLTKTVNATGLVGSTNYLLRITSHVFGTNGASVGDLTITSP